jgi:hypothetical protein
MAKRDHISLKVKLAAALLQLKHIPFSQAQRMSADQIIALYHFDHYPIPHAQGGPDEPWNLDPVLVADHLEKTAKTDIPQIAKTKRIAKDHQEFLRLMLTPRDQRPPKQSRWGKRKFEQRTKNELVWGRP